MPVNTDGGLIANGEPIGASGLRQIHELVRQLRGEAGDRQVPGEPKVGYAQLYGAPGTAARHDPDHLTPRELGPRASRGTHKSPARRRIGALSVCSPEERTKLPGGVGDEQRGGDVTEVSEIRTDAVEHYLACMAAHDWDGLADTLADEGLTRDGPFCDHVAGKQPYVEFLRGVISSLDGYQLQVQRVSHVSDRTVIRRTERDVRGRRGSDHLSRVHPVRAQRRRPDRARQRVHEAAGRRRAGGGRPRRLTQFNTAGSRRSSRRAIASNSPVNWWELKNSP